MAVSAWRTSSSLKGLIIATTSFMDRPSLLESASAAPVGARRLWHLFVQMTQKLATRNENPTAAVVTDRGTWVAGRQNAPGMPREGQALPHVWTAPCRQGFFGVSANGSGSGHVYGLEMRPVAAGPDGERGSNSNHCGALLRAMTARSVSIPVS